MTDHERELAAALSRVSGWVGARFITSMARKARAEPEGEISLRQRHYLELLAWRYRAQLPADLIPHAEPIRMPRPAPAEREPRANSTAQVARKAADDGQLGLFD